VIGSLLCRLDYNPTVKESRDPCATGVGWIHFMGAATLMIDCWLIINNPLVSRQRICSLKSKLPTCFHVIYLFMFIFCKSLISLYVFRWLQDRDDVQAAMQQKDKTDHTSGTVLKVFLF
jgi:hypothetical protein